MKEMKFLWINALVLLAASALIRCGGNESALPVLGTREVVNGDTVFHTIAPFQFVDQDSSVVTNADFTGKIYVADFFFTSCRTICPIMKTQMLRV